MRVVIGRGSGKAGRRVSLEQAEAHHLRVRRAKDGEAVEVLDGSGFRGAGRLVQSGKQWAVDIQSAEIEEPPAELTLAVAAGDRERFSWMVEKAAELGVTHIVPLETERTAGVASRLRGTHLPRLRDSALEAVKQSGATWAPLIEDPISLQVFISRDRAGARWLADGAGKPVPQLVDQDPLTVVIGPEGGLSQGERRALLTAGYLPMALGRHTLRFETAALVAAGAVIQARMRAQHG